MWGLWRKRCLSHITKAALALVQSGQLERAEEVVGMAVHGTVTGTVPKQVCVATGKAHNVAALVVLCMVPSSDCEAFGWLTAPCIVCPPASSHLYPACRLSSEHILVNGVCACR